MSTYAGLQRRLVPSAQVSNLTTGNFALPSAKQDYNESSFESIYTYIIGGGSVSSFTWSSIPQTYRHLELHLYLKSGRSGGFDEQIRVQFNADSGANYNYVYGYRQDTTAGTGSGNQNAMTLGVCATTNTSNNFSPVVFTFLDYTNTNKLKSGGGTHGVLAATANSTRVGIGSGYWNNTSAITSITFVNETASSFQEGSRFSLYGYKD